MPIFSCLIFNFDSVTRGQLGGGINLKPRPEKTGFWYLLEILFKIFYLHSLYAGLPTPPPPWVRHVNVI